MKIFTKKSYEKYRHWLIKNFSANTKKYIRILKAVEKYEATHFPIASNLEI